MLLGSLNYILIRIQHKSKRYYQSLCTFCVFQPKGDTITDWRVFVVREGVVSLKSFPYIGLWGIVRELRIVFRIALIWFMASTRHIGPSSGARY